MVGRIHGVVPFLRCGPRRVSRTTGVLHSLGLRVCPVTGLTGPGEQSTAFAAAASATASIPCCWCSIQRSRLITRSGYCGVPRCFGWSESQRASSARWAFPSLQLLGSTATTNAWAMVQHFWLSWLSAAADHRQPGTRLEVAHGASPWVGGLDVSAGGKRYPRCAQSRPRVSRSAPLFRLYQRFNRIQGGQGVDSRILWG